MKDGNTGMYGSYDAMLVWRGPLVAYGFARKSSSPNVADCEHHGQQAIREYSAVWDVYEYGESRSGSSDSGCSWGAHADAVHSSDRRALGARNSHGAAGQYAGARYEFQMYVLVRRRDFNRRPRTIRRAGLSGHHCRRGGTRGP